MKVPNRVSRHSPRLALLLLPLVVGVFGHISAATADNRFNEHRMRALQGKPQVALVRGRVLGSHGDDRLLTNIVTPRLAAQGIGELDNVWVHLGSHKLLARVMSESTFRSVTGDEEAARTLDVDVICVTGDDRRQPGMQIVGLGGGLVPWIQPRGGMQVTIEKVYY